MTEPIIETEHKLRDHENRTIAQMKSACPAVADVPDEQWRLHLCESSLSKLWQVLIDGEWVFASLVTEAEAAPEPVLWDFGGRTIADMKAIYPAIKDVPESLWQLNGDNIWEVLTKRGWQMACNFSEDDLVYEPPEDPQVEATTAILDAAEKALEPEPCECCQADSSDGVDAAFIREVGGTAEASFEEAQSRVIGLMNLSHLPPNINASLCVIHALLNEVEALHGKP